ncbi:uncharacterized protein LOC112689961 isoform X2 [Sipha flava]|uniref:Uncharacterized protein LOC112689961 isoform X2 n=1 Tax=Sipha flava TaxID=143950 RepID=A0A8B8GAI7_9HEMI|nr:uncharacterized protein LOC112689961 isoform X2 [Sipha flava]
MSPKKNAFFAFVTEYQKEQMIDQNISFSFQQLADKLTPIWNSMSDNEKNKYKIFADKLNSKRKEKKNPEQIITLHNNSSDYWKMKEYLENMFESISEEELLNTKFILLHVNCHAHEAEKYYFPAEIAALKFNLSKGVLHTYHQIVGLANNYPRGFAGGMREYSDKFHQIDCWDKNHPENYKKILSDFINFLKDEEISDLNDSTLDLPCMFTVETEIGLDMMKTKNSLERLYQTVFPEHDLLNYKSIFKIGSVERLLFEITKKTKMNLDSRSIITGLTTHDILKTVPRRKKYCISMFKGSSSSMDVKYLQICR